MLTQKRLSILVASFLGPLAGNMVLALVPALKTEFSSSAPDVLLSITFFMVPFAIIMLFSGTLSDVYDRMKTMVIGFSIYAVGCLMCASSPNLEVFLVSRTIQGFGYAFVMPVLIAILGDIVPHETRGRWMGYLGASSTAGIAMGPLVAGLIAEINWRYSFLFVGALTVLVALFFVLSFRKHTFPTGEADFSALVDSLVSCARKREIGLLAVAGFLTFLAYAGALSFVSDRLSLAPLFLSEGEIGVLMTATGIAGMISSPMGGNLVDRIGREKTATVGYFVLSLALFSLFLSHTELHYFFSLGLLGGGVAVVWSSLLTLTVEVAPATKGTVSSLFNSFRFFGYALAPVLFSPVYVAMGLGAIELIGISVVVAASAVVWMIRFSG